MNEFPICETPVPSWFEFVLVTVASYLAATLILYAINILFQYVHM